MDESYLAYPDLDAYLISGVPDHNVENFEAKLDLRIKQKVAVDK